MSYCSDLHFLGSSESFIFPFMGDKYRVKYISSISLLACKATTSHSSIFTFIKDIAIPTLPNIFRNRNIRTLSSSAARLQTYSNIIISIVPSNRSPTCTLWHPQSPPPSPQTPPLKTPSPNTTTSTTPPNPSTHTRGKLSLNPSSLHPVPPHIYPSISPSTTQPTPPNSNN